MPKKQQVRERIYRNGGEYGGTLRLFLNNLQELQSLSPDKELLIDIEAYDDYESPSVSVEVYFYRDETDFELKERTERDKAWQDRKIADAKKLLGIT